MKRLGHRPFVLVLCFALLASGVFLAVSTLSARVTHEATLPKESGEPIYCYLDAEGKPVKEVWLAGVGTYQPIGVKASPLVAVTGKPYISKSGLKTVPLRMVANGARSFAEGIGETNFWLDPSRPVMSAIWEKSPGTEFPAIQEMRFHFFYTVEAMPGKVFRSLNPAIMRSDDVRAFPPPAGTVYRMMEPVELEEMSNPGVVAGRALRNEVVIGDKRVGLARFMNWD